MVLEAADPGVSGGGVTGGAEGQGGVDEPGDPDGLEWHQGLGGMGEAGATTARAPEPAHVPHTPGPGRDALPSLGRQDLAGPREVGPPHQGLLLSVQESDDEEELLLRTQKWFGTFLVVQWLRICLPGASLVARCLRIHLPVQETRV